MTYRRPLESRPRWMSSCAGSSSSSSSSATAGSTTPESELTTEVHRPEEAVAPGSLEPAAAEVEASLAAAHATRRREGGEAAEGRRARGRRGRRPRQRGRRGRSRWWRRGGRGTCGCTRDARGARTRTRTRQRRGSGDGAGDDAARGAAPRGRRERADGGVGPRDGAGARRAEDARPLGGSSPPRAPRRRGGARGRAPRRRAASRSRRGPPSCRSTYPSGHVPPRGGMDERGRRRGERRRGVNARPSRFDLFRRGKRAPPVILLGECPGKSGVRGGASAIIAIARSLEPGRRDRSCCHLGGSGSGECRGYFWARANLANLSTQE